MPEKTGFFINGNWVTPAGTQTMQLINPADESPGGELLLGDDNRC